MDEAANAEGISVPTENDSAVVEDQQAHSAEGQETEVNATESTPSGEETTDETPKKSGVQERISQLTRRAKEAEARVKELEEIQNAVEPQEGEAVPMPKLEDFDYDQNAYSSALTEWMATQQKNTVAQTMAAQQRLQVEQARRQAVTEQLNAFRARQEAFEAEHSDFKTVMAGYQFQAPHVAQAIINAENGPAIAYHLAKNPALAQSIESANPILGAMQLGTIAAQLSAPPPAHISNAPPPPKDVNPAGVTEKSPEEMTMKEFIKWREGK